MDKEKEIQAILQAFSEGAIPLETASEMIIDIHMRVEIALKTEEPEDKINFVD